MGHSGGRQASRDLGLRLLSQLATEAYIWLCNSHKSSLIPRHIDKMSFHDYVKTSAELPM